MDTDRLFNVHIRSETPLVSPAEIKADLPLAPDREEFVLTARGKVRAILERSDPRLLILVGPCSIHNTESGLEYARRLKALEKEVGDALVPVMRVYFEKPRTTVGWKGLINDPRLDGSFRIDEGLRLARRFLLDIAALDLPAGTEALDPVVPQYIGDLVAWTAIGARTSESQTHRELASGLSSPVGFKNTTDGNMELAINAIQAAGQPHHFLGITQKGRIAVFRTRGNPHAHIILRGGLRPNYDRASLAYCREKLRAAGLPPNIVVDCSHGNSEKNHERQSAVFQDCLRQIEDGNRDLIGLMLESHLLAGARPGFAPGENDVPADQSITDACLDWDATRALLLDAAARMRPLLAARGAS